MTTSTPPQPDTADRLKNSTTCVDVNSLIIASVSSAYRLSFESTRLPDYSEWSVTDMIEAVAEGVRQAFREIASSGGQFDLPHELLFEPLLGRFAGVYGAANSCIPLCTEAHWSRHRPALAPVALRARLVRPKNRRPEPMGLGDPLGNCR